MDFDSFPLHLPYADNSSRSLVPPDGSPSSSPQPKIARIIPSTGPMLGGEVLTIHGEHFAPSDRCFVGREPANIQSLEYEGRLFVVRVPPATKAGQVLVRVVRGDLENALTVGTENALKFTYVDDMETEA